MRIIPSSGLLKGSQQNQGQDEQVMDACTKRDRVSRFFTYRFFSRIIFPWDPDYTICAILIFPKNPEDIRNSRNTMIPVAG
jgi:hypothetical protein